VTEAKMRSAVRQQRRCRHVGQRTFTEAEEAVIIAVYRAGLTQDALADRFGTTRMVVRGVLKRHGIPLRRGVRQVCSLSECSEPVVGRGLCERHYRRLLNYGDPLYVARWVNPGGRKVWPTAEERLTEFTVVERVPGLGPCHEWNGLRNRDGYGVVTVAGERWLVSRLAWTVANGPIPEGQQIRHACDNPPCLRLVHLSLGTTQDNADDKVQRGRSPHGIRHPRARLTREQVIEVRRRYALTGISQHALAREFDIHVTSVNSIVNRCSYTKIPPPAVVVRHSRSGVHRDGPQTYVAAHADSIAHEEFTRLMR
jgi:HNH endonuclease